MTAFTLPDLGEGLQEAEIVSWHVVEGDHVVADQPLLAVETEKAVVEIPSPRSGRIARILVKLGDHVKVGAPLVEFEEGTHPDTGTVVGDLGAHGIVPTAPTLRNVPGAVRAAPAARALAREKGIDLSSLQGTGPDATITRDDVMRAAAATTVGSSGGEALRGVRLAMARSMALSHQSIVPASLFDEADIDGWWSPTADITARLIRAICEGCRAEPALNCWFDAASMERRINRQVDLGIAVDTEAGLIVPVLRDADSKDVAALRLAIDPLKDRVRSRSVAPAELKGATITLSNFGTLAGQHAALVIVPPQVAIVGAGRAGTEAVQAAGGVAFRHLVPLSVTFDHRVVNGGEAARFVKAMIDDLAKLQ